MVIQRFLKLIMGSLYSHHSLSYHISYSFVQCIGYNHLYSRVSHIISKRMCCSKLMIISDLWDACREYSLKQSWESKDIVDLVRVV